MRVARTSISLLIAVSMLLLTGCGGGSGELPMVQYRGFYLKNFTASKLVASPGEVIEVYVGFGEDFPPNYDVPTIVPSVSITTSAGTFYPTSYALAHDQPFEYSKAKAFDGFPAYLKLPESAQEVVVYAGDVDPMVVRIQVVQ